MTNADSTLNIVGPRNQFPKVTLIEPTTSGYVLLALEIDHRPPIGFFIQSAAKKQVLSALKDFAKQLNRNDDVLDATVFKAILIPPGRGAFLKERPDVDIARFDVVMLVELKDIQTAYHFADSDEWTQTVRAATASASSAASCAVASRSPAPSRSGRP